MFNPTPFQNQLNTIKQKYESLRQGLSSYFTPPQKPMEFKVGEGLTPEQTQKAQEIVRKPIEYPVGEVQVKTPRFGLQPYPSEQGIEGAKSIIPMDAPEGQAIQTAATLGAVEQAAIGATEPLKNVTGKVVSKITRGIKPTPQEGRIVSQALKEASKPEAIFKSPKAEGAIPVKTSIFGKAKEAVQNYIDNPRIGLGTEDVSSGSSKLGQRIVKEGDQKPTIKLKRNVQITTLSGEKTMIPEDEVLKAYESGGKTLLKDGREYIVSKSQYENIKNNSLKSEAKEFAPANELSLSISKAKAKGITAEKWAEQQLNQFHGSMDKGLKLNDKALFLTDDFDSANTYSGGGYEWRGVKASGETTGFYAKDGKTLDLNKTENIKKAFQDIYGSPKLKKLYDTIPEIYHFIDKYDGDIRTINTRSNASDFDDWLTMEAQSNPKIGRDGLKVRTGSYSFDEASKKMRRELYDAFYAYGQPTRQSVYNNWEKLIKYSKEKGYDYIKHTTESPDASITFPETVALNPKKTLLTKSQLIKLFNQ